MVRITSGRRPTRTEREGGEAGLTRERSRFEAVHRATPPGLKKRAKGADAAGPNAPAAVASKGYLRDTDENRRRHDGRDERAHAINEATVQLGGGGGINQEMAAFELGLRGGDSMLYKGEEQAFSVSANLARTRQQRAARRVGESVLEAAQAKLRAAAYDARERGQDLERLFGRFDRNGSGDLTFGEFKGALRRICALSDSEAAEVFAHFDADRDGSLSIAEFVAGATRGFGAEARSGSARRAKRAARAEKDSRYAFTPTQPKGFITTEPYEPPALPARRGDPGYLMRSAKIPRTTSQWERRTHTEDRSSALLSPKTRPSYECRDAKDTVAKLRTRRPKRVKTDKVQAHRRFDEVQDRNSRAYAHWSPNAKRRLEEARKEAWVKRRIKSGLHRPQQAAGPLNPMEKCDASELVHPLGPNGNAGGARRWRSPMAGQSVHERALRKLHDLQVEVWGGADR
jgi:hypothetical protein